MKSKRSSLGIIIFMTAAVICAALAGLLLSHLMQQRYPQEPVQPVVVAAHDIPAGKPLKEQDLRVVPWPRSSVPAGAHDSVEQLVQRKAVPLASLLKGEPVLARHLSKPRSGMGVAAKLEPGMRAMAIRTDASVTLARLIYPGARVDLVTTLRRPGQAFGAGQVKTKVILQDVAVLAVGPEIDSLAARPRAAGRAAERDDSLSGRNADRQQQAARRVVTVAVTPGQSERLILASREGKIDLVLRSPRDRGKVKTGGATAAEVLGEPQPAKPEAAVTPEPPTERRAERARRRRHSRVAQRRAARRAAEKNEPRKKQTPEIYHVGVNR